MMAFPTEPRPSPGKGEGVSYTLVPHRDHPACAVRGVRVELREDDGALQLGYEVLGSSALLVPPRKEPDHADALWQTTCFELFVMPAEGAGYAEFNFSPSTQWAAYAFDGYRAGMVPLALDTPPQIARLDDGVRVTCDLRGLLSGAARIGLSAVIEETGGIKSYWALAHPPEGPPDFHHPACFAATLPAPRRA